MIASELAPAKINLTLHVTGQRSDGYHLLDSLVVFTEIGDTLSARKLQGLSLSITGPESAGLGAGADNLVLRAARLIGASDLAFTLEKCLPLASGIGGGSSDAAACLRLVARLRGLAMPTTRAVLGLGADVPVCLTPRTCRMQGIGEAVTPLPTLPSFWLVLVDPRVEVPTPKVFRALAQRDNAPMPATLPPWRQADDLFEFLAEQRNDLQAPACQIAPQITQVLQALSGTGGCALSRMSGSGATCFGLFASQDAAQQAEAALKAAYPGWWVAATGLVAAQYSRATT